MSSLIAQVFVDPLLVNLNLYTPPDPTYGRYLLSQSSFDIELEQDPRVRSRWRRVFIKRGGNSFTVSEGEDVLCTKEELEKGRGRDWVFYKIWERVDDEAMNGPAKGADLIMCHGMSDYSGRLAPHTSRFLAAGYRIIVPDLASHGRSTGIHVHLNSADDLTESAYAVLKDVRRLDGDSRKNKKTFMFGSSVGGWTCISYCLKYPASDASNIPIAGLFLVAPFIGIAPETRPSMATELVGRALRTVAGRFPLASAAHGNVSDDPRVERDFDADPRGYHGRLRIATGLAFLVGLDAVMTNAANFRTPIRIAHGSLDRVTDHRRSPEFINNCSSTDKQCKIYEGYQHAMLKVGYDEEDDIKRQVVLADAEKWLGERL